MSSVNKRLLLVTVLAVALVAGALVPVGLQLWTISGVMDQFRLDNAVYRKTMQDEQGRHTVEELLTPSFLDRYGLNSKDYIDKDGYFAPNGSHWSHWSLETRTAAILMWADSPDLTAWRIRGLIGLIDDYYKRNETTTPVVRVVRAVLDKSPQP